MIELQWLIKHLKGHRRYILLALSISFIIALVNLINPMIIGKIIKQVFEENNHSVLPKFLFAMLMLAALRAGLRYIMQMVLELNSQRIYKNMREEIYDKLQSMDFSFFDRNRTGDLMAKMTNDLEVIRNFVCGVIVGIFENVLIFILSFAYIGYLSWQVMCVMITISPFIALATYKFSKKIRPIFVKVMEQYSRLNTVVQENVSGNRVVKAFTRERFEINKFQKENTRFMEINIEASNTGAKYNPILDMLTHFLISAFLFVGGFFAVTGIIPLWKFVTINCYMGPIINPMKMAGNLINEVQRFFISANRVMEIMRIEPLVESPKECTDHECQGNVTFNNVSFGYPGNKICMHNICFEAKRGQTIAIIGSTGAGKTTLVSLISRFYDVTDGEILIDGIDIKNYNLQALRSKIGLAMQDVFLFSDTVEGNIAYGVPDISFEKVEECAKLAGAHEFIVKMENGYDTIIGERGVGLSGGQRQRLSLARALCKDLAILILDDTTSAVDMETEFEIQKALSGVFKEKTTFIIAHRISSVKHADIIIAIEDGRIIERGTHKELVALKGYYYDIYKTQMGSFDDEILEGVV